MKLVPTVKKSWRRDQRILIVTIDGRRKDLDDAVEFLVVKRYEDGETR